MPLLPTPKRWQIDPAMKTDFLFHGKLGIYVDFTAFFVISENRGSCVFTGAEN
jgi:hypothetical protein